MNDKAQVEFEKWWQHTQLRHMLGESLAQQVWKAAWTAAVLGQWEATKAESLEEIKTKLIAEATTAFLEGRDEDAHAARILLNRLESWDK